MCYTCSCNLNLYGWRIQLFKYMCTHIAYIHAACSSRAPLHTHNLSTRNDACNVSETTRTRQLRTLTWQQKENDPTRAPARMRTHAKEANKALTKSNALLGPQGTRSLSDATRYAALGATQRTGAKARLRPLLGLRQGRCAGAPPQLCGDSRLGDEAARRQS